MMWTKLKLVAGVAMAVGLGGAGAGVMAHGAPQARPSASAVEQQPNPDDFSWVEKRVEEWQPKPSERKFDQIGWAPDIRAGLALAKQHNRLFFLYTHNGRMATGRC